MEKTKKMWACPKCKRKFRKNNQPHSCAIYPVAKHLRGKEKAKKLYNTLTARMRKTVGRFRVESLPCCIHFVSSFTFAAVFALRDKIRIHFTLDHKLNSPRISRFSQIAAKRYMYSIDIKDESELDKELFGWIKQASKTK